MATPKYIEIHAELGSAEINFTEAPKSSINVIFNTLDPSGASGFLICTDVPACEADPIFTAWLGATPPIMPGDNVSELTNDAGYLICTDVPACEEDPIVGAVTGIVKSDGAGNISAAAQLDVETILTGEISSHSHPLHPDSITDIFVDDDPVWPIEYLQYTKNGIDYAITEIPKPDGLVSGGVVIWTGGLTFSVTAAAYYIDGVLYTSAAGNAFVPNADPNDPRIDVIVVNNSGNIGVVVGVAQPNPSEPSINILTQVKLTSVFLPAGATDIIVIPVDTDEKVKFDEADPTPGYLSYKVVGVSPITAQEGSGTNENKLEISVSLASDEEILDGIEDSKVITPKELKDAEFVAIHVGTTPPSDTRKLWLDTN